MPYNITLRLGQTQHLVLAREILRVIDSLQLTTRLKVVATPANWTPGTKVMILPHVKDADLPKLFPKGVEKVKMPSGITYVRTTTDY
ncbi:unnamed protein product [Timema podura]|uniref:Peroxiredoxin C-terminal domain-containing protein n=1 Tax=Timema podura TaxID=61482 RepID=A0ABN7NU93_TIMPD|nr:unnamed protein product [Timema podura]